MNNAPSTPPTTPIKEEIITVIRYGSVFCRYLSIFSSPIKKGKYGYLMMMIESESSFKYALAIVYDMLKND